jgi:NADH:ubiquinone oxidoreductase subunit E
MAWKTIDRNQPLAAADAPPLLSEAVRDKIRSFFPRYETKRAALLPALHVVQDALGHVPPQAMLEIAEVLDLPPSAVLDTVSFYTHFWTAPKGRKVITACRSISCEVMGGAKVLAEVKRRLGIGEHETTADGAYSLTTEECLAGCDHAPCLLINERLHSRVRAEDVGRLLDDPNNDRIDVPRSTLFDAPGDTSTPGAKDGNGDPDAGASEDDAKPRKKERSAGSDRVGSTSDVREMREAD